MCKPVTNPSIFIIKYCVSSVAQRSLLLCDWQHEFLYHCHPRSRALRWHVITATMSLSWNFQLCRSLRAAVWYAHHCNFVWKWVFLYVSRSQGTRVILIFSLPYVLYVVLLNVRYLVFLLLLFNAPRLPSSLMLPDSPALSERWVCVEDRLPYPRRPHL